MSPLETRGNAIGTPEFSTALRARARGLGAAKMRGSGLLRHAKVLGAVASWVWRIARQVIADVAAHEKEAARHQPKINVPPGIRRKQGGWVAHRAGGRRPKIVTISSNVTSGIYDMNTGAGGGGSAGAHWIFVIAPGVVVFNGMDTGNPAFWPAGTRLSIVNHGTIAGTGGAGGGGGGQGGGGSGGNGGTAINMQQDLTIDNTDGFIFGGAGGGGGGGGATSSDKTHTAGGGGGGGGRGYNNAGGGSGGSGIGVVAGNAGNPGSSSGAGGGGGGFLIGDATSGTGGTGGDWATAGSAGGDGTGGFADFAGAAGGAAGLAVALNGFTLTQVAGFDGPTGTHVRGAIA